MWAFNLGQIVEADMFPEGYKFTIISRVVDDEGNQYYNLQSHIDKSVWEVAAMNILEDE